MTHHIQISDKNQVFCTRCGSTDNFKEGCKFAVEITTSKVEMSKIALEEKKIFYEAISTFVVYVICFIFIAVIYLGFDNVKIQMSRMYEECRKGN